MPLTPAQLTTLKSFIANPANGLNGFPQNSDGAFAVAAAMNQQASPDWTVWRKLVTITEVGDKINGTELAGLSSLNSTRLQTVVILSQAGVNPSLIDRRQFFDDIFSGAGGATTRANLLALWKRLATVAQKLFSTGTGSNASPATTDTNISDGFTLSVQDVISAWAQP